MSAVVQINEDMSNLMLKEVPSSYGESNSKNSLIAFADKLSGLPSVVVDSTSELFAERTFSVIAEHKDLIQFGKDGFASGVARGENGKIIKQLKFKQNGVNVHNLLKGIGTQCLLLHISFELQNISSKIDNIRQTLREDRFSEISGSLNNLRFLIEAGKTDIRADIATIRNSLCVGLDKAKNELKDNIKNVPTAHNGLFENWFDSGEKKRQNAIKMCKETIYYIEQANMGLFFCEFFSHEPNMEHAFNTLKSELQNIVSIHPTIQNLSRGLQNSNKNQQDEILEKNWQNRTAMLLKKLENIESSLKEELVIEIPANLIEEIDYEYK